MQRVLLIADSLAFHGPERAELLTEPRLWPNVMAAELGVEVDWCAGLGWTARDAWWALTKNPQVYSFLLPRADVVILAIGGMDHLPAMLPTYLREGLAYLRPGWLRRRVRRLYLRAHPHGVRALHGRLRVLPQAATDHYLTRCVEALRVVRPHIPIIGIVPSPYGSAYFGGITTTHAPAVAAHRAWGSRLGVPLVDLDRVVTPYADAGKLNPDGMHWPWEVHAEVGRAFAAAVRSAAAHEPG
ncbi:MAG TPA: diglucosylglycerate octanoyltransferase [Mycobacteriales bacterium]|nr:diglucosylglycerate octanoyltransferase [Mycobacteriales bacterium]